MRNNLKYIFTLNFIVFTISTFYAQQKEIIRFNLYNQFLHNPGATGISNDILVTAYHQKAFTGVTRAPGVSLVSLQLPIPKLSMNLGASLQTKSIGILQDSRIGLTYSYRIRSLFSGSDFVSIGISGEFAQLRINGSKLAAGVNLSDQTISQMVESGIGNNFGVGLVYASAPGLSRNIRTILRTGLSGKLSLKKNSVISNFSFEDQQEYSGFIMIETDIDNDIILKPMIEANYDSNEFFDGRVSLSGEFNRFILVGASMDTGGFLGFQAGVNLGRVMYLDDAQQIYVVLAGVLPLGNSNQFLNTGYSAKVIYRFERSERMMIDRYFR